MFRRKIQATENLDKGYSPIPEILTPDTATSGRADLAPREEFLRIGLTAAAIQALTGDELATLFYLAGVAGHKTWERISRR